MEDAWKSFFCVVTSWMRRGFLYIQNKVSRNILIKKNMDSHTRRNIVNQANMDTRSKVSRDILNKANMDKASLTEQGHSEQSQYGQGKLNRAGTF